MFALLLLALSAQADPIDLRDLDKPAIEDPEAERDWVGTPEDLAEYAERRVILGRADLVGSESGKAYGSWNIAVKGEGREPLKGRDFYDYVGRDDLGDQYQRRVRTRWAIAGGGLAISLGGLVAAARTSRTMEECDYLNGQEYTDCIDAGEKKEKTRSVVAITMLFGGGVVFYGSRLVKPDPISPEEAHQLVEGFNGDLRRELGLTSAALQDRRGPVIAHLRGGLWASDGGGGLVVQGRF